MNAKTACRRAAELVQRARRIVVLTGAGVSTPSGIPDFRSPGAGLWSQRNPLLVASMPVFRVRPHLFYEWVRPLARRIVDAAPNSAHTALAQLEQVGRLRAVITQNIDGLHQRAGSRRVIELHGHMREATCMRCHRTTSTAALLPRFLEDGEVPRCAHCKGVLKPNVVLFGERLPARALRAARAEARACDLMIVAGSSLRITPASTLPDLVLRRRADVIVLNREPTRIDAGATLVIRQDVSTSLPCIAALATRQHLPSSPPCPRALTLGEERA
jgi:NAD-dependent deacetylase